jgi:hypothetical protein
MYESDHLELKKVPFCIRNKRKYFITVIVKTEFDCVCVKLYFILMCKSVSVKNCLRIKSSKRKFQPVWACSMYLVQRFKPTDRSQPRVWTLTFTNIWVIHSEIAIFWGRVVRLRIACYTTMRLPNQENKHWRCFLRFCGHIYCRFSESR